MTAQLLSSKLIIQEEPPSLRTVQGVATGIVACLGLSQKGPVGVATLCTSQEQFVNIFGGDIQQSFSASAVRGYFQGGGTRLYFTRIVHYTNVLDPATKTSAAGSITLLSAAAVPAGAQVTGSIAGPFALTTGDTLVVTRDAAGSATATFTATAAAITTASESAPPYTLANGQTLFVRIDGEALQTITFTTASFVNIAQATQSEVVVAINAQLTGALASPAGATGLTITSSTSGTSSSVEITGGTANGELAFATATAIGTGNVADISQVSVAEIKTVVEAAVSGVTVADFNGAVRITAGTVGPSGSLQVQTASTAKEELGLDTVLHAGSNGSPGPTLQVAAKYDGAYASTVSVLVQPPTAGLLTASTDFDLKVLVNGVVAEQYPNLTMLDTATRHVEKIVNSLSNYITVTDLQLSPGFSGAAAERPAYSPGTPRVPFGPLAGGNDGITDSLGATTLREIDFIGDAASRTGLYSFDLLDDPDLLITPDLASPAMHNSGLSYCSVKRNGDMFYVMDPPAGLSADGVNQYVVNQAAIKNSTEHGAFYWPRIKVINPSASIYGDVPVIVVPASGHVVGMFARVDGSQVGGVYLPPGGVERGQMPGVVGLENESVLDERVRDLITPNLINPITRVRGWPIAVDDVLTLQAGGNFPTIAERRGVTFIERSLKDGLQFCRLRNNDADLRRAVYRTCQMFLIAQMKAGAFRTTDPATAFFIDCGEAINPPSEQFAGRLNVRIGLATNKPARWIIISFAQDTRALDEELAAAS